MIESPHSSTPQRLGDFEILRELGRGGMGVVYEARQVSLNRRVALKVLSGGLGLTGKAVKRFRREAEAAAKLHHTNIVPIYATGEENGIHFYAMELVEGPSLDRVIRQMRVSGGAKEPSEGNATTVEPDASGVSEWVRETIGLAASSPPAPSPSSEDSTRELSISGSASGTKYFDTVATMMADVADALQHAHDEGVIHRDIKPSNLLLSPDGRVSINDFGLARILEQPGMTMSGEFVGSPLYMSPEQITAGRAPLDHRTDIYSLGATLYELLTLQPPFPGKTRDEVIGQILHKEPRAPRRLNGRVPVDLETICLKSIERDPDRRYQTAKELARDLQAFVSHHAISARRLGPIGMAIKFVRRNPLAASFAAFVLLTVLAVGVGYKFVRDHQRELDRQAEIAMLQDQLVDDVFRGVTKNADDLITRAIKREASDEQIEFMQGLQDFFQQNYEEAKLHFDKVLESDADHIPARSLKAVAVHHHGDEFAYFDELGKINLTKERTFEDNFFLGFAHSWGDSVLAESLLDEAERAEPNHLYVKLLRGITRRNTATLVDLEVAKAKEHIDQAYEDIISVAGSIRTPLVLKELAWVRIDRAKIYREYIEKEQVGVDELGPEIERTLEDARGGLEELLSPELQEHEDTQYAAVTLLIYLGEEDKLREITDRWLDEGKEVHVYTAQTIALHCAAQKDYQRAKQWSKRFVGPVAQNSRFVSLFIDLLSGDTSFRELQKRARENVQRKVDSDHTEYMSFDLLCLYLLGVDELVRYADDKIYQLILGGELYTPHMEYFSAAPDKRPSKEEFLAECQTGRGPHVRADACPLRIRNGSIGRRERG